MVADPALARNRFCVQGVHDTAGMFTAAILISLIGVVLYGLVLLLERLLVVGDRRPDPLSGQVPPPGQAACFSRSSASAAAIMVQASRP
jgi:hypothetical protein